MTIPTLKASFEGVTRVNKHDSNPVILRCAGDEAEHIGKTPAIKTAVLPIFTLFHRLANLRQVLQPNLAVTSIGWNDFRTDNVVFVSLQLFTRSYTQLKSNRSVHIVVNQCWWKFYMISIINWLFHPFPWGIRLELIISLETRLFASPQV